MSSVDVVIPNYNYARFLPQCVDSVLSQSVEDLRILIVDNASNDGSAEIAQQLATDDQRIEVILRTENQGPHASFNTGVDQSSADYLMILCSDDLLVPGSLSGMISVLDRHKQASFALGTDLHWHGGERQPQLEFRHDARWCVRDGIDFVRERCRRPEGYLAAGMVLVRTSVQKEAGHYRPSLPHTDDFEMLLRLAVLGKVAQTTSAVGIKRLHTANRTHAYLQERTRDLVERIAALESFFENEGHILEDAKNLLELGRKSIAERAYWCGIKDIARGRSSAGGLLRLAFRYSPRTAFVPPVGYFRRMDRTLLESVFG